MLDKKNLCTEINESLFTRPTNATDEQRAVF